MDLKNLICRNTENQMIVIFEKRGTALEAKIKNMPEELAEEWAWNPNSARQMKKALIEADEVFFRAYFNREIQKKCAGIRVSA